MMTITFGTIGMYERKSKILFYEALKAQESERDTYEVIIATQSREGMGRPHF